MTIDPVISLAFGLPLAILLAASAMHKLFSFREFVIIVRNYELAPSGAVTTIVVVLLIVESTLAAGLVTEAFRTPAALGAAGIFAVYAAVIAINIRRGRVAIDCGCSFGATSDQLSMNLLYRNAVLVAAALVAATPVSDRVLGIFDYVTGSIFCATFAALYLAFEALRANVMRFYATERSR